MKKNQNYRFAFVGVTSSGKTCILGRLAQQADSDKRYSSTLVNPATNIIGVANVPPDSEEAIAIMGYKKIRDAQTAFEKNQCPEATQTQETGRLPVTFDMTDEERGEFRITTEDYSGELINAELLSGQKNMSSELIKKLCQYDGLIFVVETLDQNDDVKKASDYALELCRYFSAIKNQMGQLKWETTPFAIIFSKWDKFSQDINYDFPESEEDKLNGEFLEQYPFYKNLVKRVEALTNTQDSLSDLESENGEGTTTQLSESEQKRIEENTKCFPVSAFGKGILENGNYRPNKDAQAFGIVAPFAWMVKRLDDMKRIELEKESKSVWNWFWFVKPFCLQWKAGDALKRIPKKTENGKTLSQIKYWAWFQFLVSLIVDLMIVYLFGHGLTWGIDTCYLNQYQIVVNNQTATQEQVNQAHDVVRSYEKSAFRSKVFQLFRSTKPLADAITKITEKRDDVLWGGVDSPKNEAEKYEAAKRYLENFPNGKHKEEAINIITAYENKLKDKEIEEFKKLLENDQALCIQQCNVFIERWKTGVHVDTAQKIKAEAIDRIQVKEIEEIKTIASKDLSLAITRCDNFIKQNEKGVHVEEARKLREEYIDKVGFGKQISSYRSLYTGKDDESLTNMLIKFINEHGSTNEKIATLIGEYPNVLKEMLIRKCEGNPESDNIKTYQAAITRVDNLLKSLKGNEALVALKRELDHQIQIQVNNMDKKLYQDILKKPDKSYVDDYMKKMNSYGGGRMRKEVEAYQKWLEGQDVVKEYTVSISMKWDANTGDRNVRAKIWVDDLANEKYNQNGVFIDKNLEKKLTEVKIKKKFSSDSVYFKAEFVSEGNWAWFGGLNGVNWGAGANTFKVSSLVNGGEFSLPPNGTLKVKIIDAPPKPPLPQWKEK